MIDAKTIISTTDDKLTLLQWLKKVEEALKNGSLTGVTTSQTSDGKTIFKFTFADGTSVDSDPISVGSSLDEFIKHDATTNTTDIGTNAEIDGNLQVNGKIVKIDDTLAFGYLPVKDTSGAISINFSLPAFIWVPHAMGTANLGEGDITLKYSGAYARFFGSITINVDGDSSLFDGWFEIYNSKGEKATTMDEVLDGGYLKSEDIFSLYSPVYFDSDLHELRDVRGAIEYIQNITLDNVNIRGSSTIIHDNVTIGETNATSVSLLLNKLSTASQASYQHTLVITLTPSDSSFPTGKIVVQGMSSKNTPIDSYQDLSAVFGGCSLKWSGYLNSGQGTSYGGYLDLHGGTIATDKIMGFVAAITIQNIALSSFSTIKYEDDVSIPK